MDGDLDLYNLIENTVIGLKEQGYEEAGGSSVWRLLHDPITGRDLKVFLNNYEKPTHIIMRYST